VKAKKRSFWLILPLLWGDFCPLVLAANSEPIRRIVASSPRLQQPPAIAPARNTTAPAALAIDAAASLAAPAAGDLANLTGEQAKDLSGRPFELSAGRQGPSEVAAVTATPDSRTGRLERGRKGSTVRYGLLPPIPAGGPAPSLIDHYHHARLWAQNVWFYHVVNIVAKWRPYHAKWRALAASGAVPPVSRPRAFFAHLRVIGLTGGIVVLGSIPRDDAAMLEEARRSFARYFDSPKIGAREKAAFSDFLTRAVDYNAGKRAITNLRKIIRDSMLEASAMPVENVAAFFDDIYRDGAAQQAVQYQNGAAAALLRKFERVIIDEIRMEPRHAKGRVLGVILIGSFATGSATPKSDFDGEIITAGGSAARLNGFVERVKKRWEQEGLQSANPVTFHMYPLTGSRALIRMIHHSSYLVITPYADLAAELAMKDGEPPGFAVDRALTPVGRILRGIQFAAVYLTTRLSDQI
jgi:predicted nucleotidyltransferase